MNKIILFIFLSVSFNLFADSKTAEIPNLIPANQTELMDSVGSTLNTLNQVTEYTNEYYKKNYSDIGLTMEYGKMMALAGSSCSLLAYQSIVKALVKAAVMSRELFVNKAIVKDDFYRINTEMNVIFNDLNYKLKDQGEACLAYAPRLQKVTNEYWYRVAESFGFDIK